MRVERTRTIRLDAARCVAARKRHGLSREALEHRSGISVATLKRAEHGNPIYLQTANILARALDVPLKTLVLPSELEAILDLVEHAHASVAVVPFDAVDRDDSSVYIAGGLTEDLICRLTRSLFPVISASSSFGVRGGALDAESFGNRVQADYVVVGAVQRDGSRVRVTARVVRQKDQQVLCARRYDQTFQDLFSAQDELAARIADQVGSMILDAESALLLRKDPADLDAWELAVRGSWHFHSRTSGGNAQARLFFEKALAADPDLPLAWYSLALTYQREIVNLWTSKPGDALSAMRRVCTEFGRRYPHDPWLHVAASYVAVYSGERDSAMSRLSEAIQIDPNLPAAYSLYGQTLAMANEPDRAIEQFETAMRLSPLDSDLWSVYTAVALAHFVAERYAETVRWAQRAVELQPEIPFPHGTLAAAFGHLGRLEEARVELGKLLKFAPDTTIQGMSTLVASTNPEIARRYQAGLRRAGLSVT